VNEQSSKKGGFHPLLPTAGGELRIYLEPSAALDLSHNILKAKIMGLIKEPKNVDLSTKSEPWTEQELIDFRKIMQDIKAKNAKRKERSLKLKTNKKQPA